MRNWKSVEYHRIGKSAAAVIVWMILSIMVLGTAIILVYEIVAPPAPGPEEQMPISIFRSMVVILLIPLATLGLVVITELREALHAVRSNLDHYHHETLRIAS